jgi:hypothetical protein
VPPSGLLMQLKKKIEHSLMPHVSYTCFRKLNGDLLSQQDYQIMISRLSFEVRHTRCVEPKLQNGKRTVKTQLYIELCFDCTFAIL